MQRCTPCAGTSQDPSDSARSDTLMLPPLRGAIAVHLCRACSWPPRGMHIAPSFPITLHCHSSCRPCSASTSSACICCKWVIVLAEIRRCTRPTLLHRVANVAIQLSKPHYRTPCPYSCVGCSTALLASPELAPNWNDLRRAPICITRWNGQSAAIACSIKVNPSCVRTTAYSSLFRCAQRDPGQDSHIPGPFAP